MKSDLESLAVLKGEGLKMLALIGINKVDQLIGQNSEVLFEKICRKTELQQDPEIKEQIEKAIKIVESMPLKTKTRKRNPQLLS